MRVNCNLLYKNKSILSYLQQIKAGLWQTRSQDAEPAKGRHWCASSSTFQWVPPPCPTGQDPCLQYPWCYTLPCTVLCIHHSISSSPLDDNTGLNNLPQIAGSQSSLPRHFSLPFTMLYFQVATIKVHTIVPHPTLQYVLTTVPAQVPHPA